jgi:hypothetical protein
MRTANDQSHAMQAFLDAIPNPIFLFGPTKIVLFANAAAKKHPGRPLEYLKSNALVRTIVGDALSGKLAIPYLFEMNIRNDIAFKGQFVAGPNAGEIALVAGNGSASLEMTGPQSNSFAVKSVFALIRNEIGPPINLLCSQFKAPADGAAVGPIESAAREIKQRMSKISDLIEVFGDQVALAPDRVDLVPLVEEICGELSPRIRMSGHHHKIMINCPSLPPVYGNEKLIRRALRESLEHVLTHCNRPQASEKRSCIEIRFGASNAFAIVSIHSPPKNNVLTNPTVNAGPQSALRGVVTHDTPFNTGLPLAEKIMQLQGGGLHRSMEYGQLTNLILSFRTGAPTIGQREMSTTQMEMYAKDFAQLMLQNRRLKNEEDSTHC